MAHQVNPTGPNERNVSYHDDRGNDYRAGRGDFRPYSPVARIVWTVFGIVAVLLVVRFFLQLVGADPAAGFTNFIYQLTNPLVQPFTGTIPNTIVETGVVEWITILALAIYWLVAWILARLATTPRTAMRGY
jgi:hypothetical protein